jgi:hypothetical protein
VNRPDARLWHPWLRINRVLRVMLHIRWSAEAVPRPSLREAWSQVRVEFRKAVALRSEIVGGDRVWVMCSYGAVECCINL